MQDKFSCAGRLHEAIPAVSSMEDDAADGNSDERKVWIFIVDYTGIAGLKLTEGQDRKRFW